MRKAVAKAFLPRLPDVWRYFGLDGYGDNFYKAKGWFSPSVGPLSITAPRQLHYTERQNGVPVKMDGLGGYEMKRDIIEGFDGLPPEFMHDAIEYVATQEGDRGLYRPLKIMADRGTQQTKSSIARELHLSRPGLDYRLRDACILVLEYIDQYLEREASKGDNTRIYS